MFHVSYKLFVLTCACHGILTRGARQRLSQTADERPGSALRQTPSEDAYQAGMMNMTWLDPDNSRCLDGSPAGYYYAPPSDGESSLWVISLDGGGGCQDNRTCAKWAGQQKGNSSQWALHKFGVRSLSGDENENPDFHDAHHVKVPYCTGDTHQGQTTAPSDGRTYYNGQYQYPNEQYYFYGHNNFKAILQHIFTTKKTVARDMKRLLLIGGSAGGKGVYANCDKLRDGLLHKLKVEVDVRCSAQAGWYMPGRPAGFVDNDLPPVDYDSFSLGLIPSADYVATALSHGVQLKGSFLPDRCVETHAGEEWKCDMVHNLYPSMEAPMYIIQDEFDTSVSGNLGRPKEVDDWSQVFLGEEWIAYMGESMRTSTDQVHSKSQDGMFRTACFEHGSAYSASPPRIQQYTAMEGLGDWFNDRTGSSYAPRILVDSCSLSPPGLPCNPDCANLQTSACTVEVNNQCADYTESMDACGVCIQANQQALDLAGCNLPEDTEYLCTALVSA